jgi:hypothetical protein
VRDGVGIGRQNNQAAAAEDVYLGRLRFHECATKCSCLASKSQAIVNEYVPKVKKKCTSLTRQTIASWVADEDLKICGLAFVEAASCYQVFGFMSEPRRKGFNREILPRSLRLPPSFFLSKNRRQ